MEPKKSTFTPLSAELISQLAPDANLALPKVRQLYLALYHAVTNAQLPHGTQLPPSRELATRHPCPSLHAYYMPVRSPN